MTDTQPPPGKDIGELAKDRRVAARHLTVAWSLTGCAVGGVLVSGGKGAWAFLAFTAFYALGDTILVLWSTRRLVGTLPSERGKRSDDRALQKAQRSWGCLPVILGCIIVLSAIWFVWRAELAWMFLRVLACALLGHFVAILIIRWARRQTPEASR